jgi:hypothetical protein
MLLSDYTNVLADDGCSNSALKNPHTRMAMDMTVSRDTSVYS